MFTIVEKIIFNVNVSVCHAMPCHFLLTLWKKYFLRRCCFGKKQIEMWFSILTTVMTRIVVDKSTDHAKVHSIR